MRCSAMLLFLFGVGNSKPVDEQDDGLALLQTKLVREHAEMNVSGVDPNLQNFCSSLQWADECRCWPPSDACLGTNAKRLAGCTGDSAPDGRTMHDACNAFNGWADECIVSCTSSCLGSTARKLGNCDSLPACGGAAISCGSQTASCVGSTWTCPAPVCVGAQPSCVGATCNTHGGAWNCPSTAPAICTVAQPRCAGVACIDGQWMCNGDYCPGTDSPGGETDVTDAQCLDADRGFGPGFSCANTEMYCSSDSGDGLTVGTCCPTKCKKEFEKKKNSNAENKGKSESERKGKRAGNEGERKKNEKDRKKKRKDTEWNSKRDASETQNKNAEDERKSKRGWKEGQRKNERGWKQNKRQRQAAADQRERARKETTNKNNKPAISKKDCSKNKKKYAKCKANAKCEKKFKKKGRKEPNC